MTISAKRHVKDMVAEANSRIKTVPVAKALQLVGSNRHIFVDIRDIRELRKTGKIPGAFHMSRGMLEFWIDPDSPYHRAIFDEDKSFVFYCASAWRSALATDVAQSMGLEAASHLEGGFTAWQQSDGPIEPMG